MEPGNKIPTLPLIYQTKLSKKASKKKNHLSIIDIFKSNALKGLEQTDSGSEDEMRKESPSGGDVRKRKLKLAKRAKQTNKKSNASRTSCGGVKTTRIKKKNGNMRHDEHQENGSEKKPSQTAEYTEVTTMVSEVTISDVEKETKNRSRKREKMAPELSSPDLRRPSSAFRRKSSRIKVTAKDTQNQVHKPEKVKEEIKDRSLVVLQKHLQKMAEGGQNSVGRAKGGFGLYFGNRGIGNSKTSSKVVPNGIRRKSTFNQPAFANQKCPDMDSRKTEPTFNENSVLPKSTLKVEHANAPDIKIIPPADDVTENPYHLPKDASSPKYFPELLVKYPSELPTSAKETWQTYQKLQRQGFPVSLKTLQRGLMTPTDQRIMNELFIQSQTRNGSHVTDYPND